MRILTNEDLEKVDAIESFEELKDREQHFKLHYSKDNEAMQEWHKQRKQVKDRIKACGFNFKTLIKVVVSCRFRDLRVVFFEGIVDSTNFNRLKEKTFTPCKFEWNSIFVITNWTF